jgi:hypothetical protein
VLRGCIVTAEHDGGQVLALLAGERRGGGEDLGREVLDSHDSALALQVGDAVRIGMKTAVLGSDLRTKNVLAGCHEGLLGRDETRPLPRSRTTVADSGGVNTPARSSRTA